MKFSKHERRTIITVAGIMHSLALQFLAMTTIVMKLVEYDVARELGAFVILAASPYVVFSFLGMLCGVMMGNHDDQNWDWYA